MVKALGGGCRMKAFVVHFHYTGEATRVIN